MGAVHTQGTHLSRKAPAGWFERGQSKMFVSRGLGESIPLRFGARPQVALITLPAGQRNQALLRTDGQRGIADVRLVNRAGGLLPCGAAALGGNRPVLVGSARAAAERLEAGGLPVAVRAEEVDERARVAGAPRGLPAETGRQVFL